VAADVGGTFTDLILRSAGGGGWGRKTEKEK
jgi:N-methylhydantoinase A/oxoprolinase/acetone carboxylase beta subunit